jgi:hypothetical protein
MVTLTTTILTLSAKGARYARYDNEYAELANAREYQKL